MVNSTPRRLLVIGSPECNLSKLVKDLTGSSPPLDPSGSIAGSIHSWSIKTAYYEAEIPLWIDEIHDLDRWQADFSSPEAKEVVQALGGCMCCFLDLPEVDGLSVKKQCRVLISAVNQVIEKACGNYGWDGLKLAVRLAPSLSTVVPASAALLEELDDVCLEGGFELVDAAASGTNDFGERLGLGRIRESVETNDWSGSTTVQADEEESDGYGDFATTLQAESDLEFNGLKQDLIDLQVTSGDATDRDHAQSTQVDKLERLMQQAVAIKESGADLPLEQRKRFAERAISQMLSESDG